MEGSGSKNEWNAVNQNNTDEFLKSWVKWGKQKENTLYASACSPRPGKTDQKHQKDSDSMVEIKDWTGHGKRGLGYGWHLITRKDEYALNVLYI